MYMGWVYADPCVHAFIIGKSSVLGIKHCFLDVGPSLEGRVALGHNQSIRSTKSGKWCYNNMDNYFSFHREWNSKKTFPKWNHNRNALESHIAYTLQADE